MYVSASSLAGNSILSEVLFSVVGGYISFKSHVVK